MRKKRVISGLFSVILLIVGLIIYLFLRADTFIHLLLPPFIQKSLYDIYLQTEKNLFIDFLRFYFVDFLWGASLSCSLCAIMPNLDFKHIMAGSSLAFLSGTLYELLQLFDIIYGTFDILDLCMYAAASLSCVAINIKFILRRTL